MKFSVLLPTRNRLEYLRYAVESVRRQDYDDWEVIVSDNYSEEDIAGYVRGLNDPRIKYYRTDRPVPVTENWNNALLHSDGDYVVMLGDDDGLLPRYFSTLRATMESMGAADYVYVSAYFLAYPGAMPSEPEGFLRRDRNRMFTSESSYWLSESVAKRIALAYLDFRMPVASNMQFSLISRGMVQELTQDGPFFRSPFPDFYATPLLFLKSRRILIYPHPMVVVGITPKSYGAFHFSDRPVAGTAMLQNETAVQGDLNIRALMLPGTAYNDSWLLAMQALREGPNGHPDVRPNYRRYRRLQIIHSYKSCYFDGRMPSDQLQALRSKMNLGEVLLYAWTLPICFSVLRWVSPRIRNRLILALRSQFGQHVIAEQDTATAHYENLLAVYDAMDSTVAQRLDGAQA